MNKIELLKELLRNTAQTLKKTAEECETWGERELSDGNIAHKYLVILDDIGRRVTSVLGPNLTYKGTLARVDGLIDKLKKTEREFQSWKDNACQSAVYAERLEQRALDAEAKTVALEAKLALAEARLVRLLKALNDESP